MNNSETQAAVAQEVNSRMERAAEEIAAKYASGKGGLDASETGPTGQAYKDKENQERRVRQVERARLNAEMESSKSTTQHDEEEDEEGGTDDDYELRMLREQRLREIKSVQREKIENIGKGHGQYREIAQDEFLAEVTSSDRVVCHFYHRDFSRCAIIDHHIQRLVGRHIETKFIKIDAEKAPFFVEKVRYSSSIEQFPGRSRLTIFP